MQSYKLSEPFENCLYIFLAEHMHKVTLEILRLKGANLQSCTKYTLCYVPIYIAYYTCQVCGKERLKLQLQASQNSSIEEIKIFRP